MAKNSLSKIVIGLMQGKILKGIYYFIKNN